MSGKPYHHGNLRAALIAAGLELIAEKGIAALTLREIGTRVGVSRMAAYRHFADKDDLLAAISEASFLAFGDALAAALALAPAPPAARLEALGRAYIHFAATHRPQFDVMFGPQAPAPRGEPNVTAATRSFRILEDTIREGQATGDVQPGNPTDLARTAWALVHGISTLSLAAYGAPFLEQAFQVLRAGLSAARPMTSSPPA